MGDQHQLGHDRHQQRSFLADEADEAPLSVIPQWLVLETIRNTYSKEMDLIAEAKASLHAAIETWCDSRMRYGPWRRSGRTA